MKSFLLPSLFSLLHLSWLKKKKKTLLQIYKKSFPDFSMASGYFFKVPSRSEVSLIIIIWFFLSKNLSIHISFLNHEQYQKKKFTRWCHHCCAILIGSLLRNWILTLFWISSIFKETFFSRFSRRFAKTLNMY